MSTSESASAVRLPPLSVEPLSSASKKKTTSLPTELQLPLIPAATKAEKYARLRHFDKHGLKRHKAHFRNALKTTEPIQKITKQLHERLSGLGEDDEKVSFERLAVFSDAFEGVIKQSGTYAPVLKKIKEVYHDHIMELLREEPHPCTHSGFIPSAAEPLPPAPPTSTRELAKLRKQLHQLEVEFRVAAETNEKLQVELAEEEKVHEEAMAELTKPLETTPTLDHQKQETDELDYISQVEHLQQQIVNERLAIAKVALERKGRIPLSVCHQLEQCIREVEIEIQKQQRRNEKLTKEIEQLTQQLEGVFRSHGYTLTASEILAELGLDCSEAATQHSIHSISESVQL